MFVLYSWGLWKVVVFEIRTVQRGRIKWYGALVPLYNMRSYNLAQRIDCQMVVAVAHHQPKHSMQIRPL
jgi:hypothetical protein